MLANELKLVKSWYGSDSGSMNAIIFVKKIKKKKGKRKILVNKGYQYFITEYKLLLKSLFAYVERKTVSEWDSDLLLCMNFFPTSPAIAKCSMKKFIRVFMPFSEYISDSRTHPLPTTISRNSDVSITNWGTYKKWTKNTKPN